MSKNEGYCEELDLTLDRYHNIVAEDYTVEGATLRIPICIKHIKEYQIKENRLDYYNDPQPGCPAPVEYCGIKGCDHHAAAEYDADIQTNILTLHKLKEEYSD